MSEWLGPVSYVVKYLGKALPFAARWYYSEAKLNSLLFIDISSSGEGINYYYAGQEARCWLQLTNMSPFDFTIERLQVSATTDGGDFVCSLVLPEIVEGGTRKRIFVTGKSPVTLQNMEMMKKSTKARVEITAFIASAVRTFPVRCLINEMRNIQIG